MVPALKPSLIGNNNNPTSIGLAPGSAILFNSLEFITDRIGCLSLSPQEWDSSAIFIAMVHSGSPTLCTTLDESSNKDGSASVTGGSSRSPGHQWCNMVTSIDLIITRPAPENTPALQTISTVMVRMAVPQPGRELLPNQQQTNQEEQQA
jgi:hypothetical protein